MGASESGFGESEEGVTPSMGEDIVINVKEIGKGILMRSSDIAP